MNSEHLAICWLEQDKKKHSLARHISKHLSTCVPTSTAYSSCVHTKNSPGFHASSVARDTNIQSPHSCFWIPICFCCCCLLSLLFLSPITGLHWGPHLQLAPSAVHLYPVDLHTVTSLYCHALVARFCSCTSPGQQPEAPRLLVGTYKAPLLSLACTADLTCSPSLCEICTPWHNSCRWPPLLCAFP